MGDINDRDTALKWAYYFTHCATIDMFAGAGGIRLAFEQVGFKTVFASDLDHHCKLTYDLNFDSPKLYQEDIWKLDISEIPEFNILTGGFPCQAFSIAGKREGLKKDRAIVRIQNILSEKKPEAFFLENVRGIDSHEHLDIIKGVLCDTGYCVKTAILASSSHANIPQSRERYFFVGFLDDKKYNLFEFPKPVQLTKTAYDFLDKDVDPKYYRLSPAIRDKLRGYKTSEGRVYRLKKKPLENGRRRTREDWVLEELKDGVVGTLTTGEVPILICDRIGIRKATPRECFRLQGFPDDYKLPNLADSHLYRMAGNSVTVPLIRRIAENIKNTFKASESMEGIPTETDVLRRATLSDVFQNLLIGRPGLTLEEIFKRAKKDLKP